MPNTLTGIIFSTTGGAPGFPFAIRENIFTGKSVPTWLMSWAFANEYEANLVLAMHLANPNLSANELQHMVPFVFRALKLKSKWAE